MSTVANAVESPSNAKPLGGNRGELNATDGAGLNRETERLAIPGFARNASAVKAGGLP